MRRLPLVVATLLFTAGWLQAQPLFTDAAAPMRVAESQAVNTAGGA